MSITEQQFDILADALKSEDWNKRRVAAFELGGIGEVRAFNLLMQALEVEKNRAVYSHIMVALTRFGETGLSLLFKATHNENQELASKIAETVEIMKVTASTDTVMSFLDTKDADVKQWAITVLEDRKI